MIIWRGWGIFVAVIFIAFILGAPPFFDLLVDEPRYYDNHGFPKLIAFSLMAALFWYIGTKFESVPGRILEDPLTKERVELKTSHELFFIPIKWWAIPAAAAGVIAICAKGF